MNVVLVGPSLSQRGGIVSVLYGLNSFLISSGVSVRVIPTTAEGGGWRSFAAFILGWISISNTCLFRKSDVVHLHMSFRGSCLRKSLLGLTCWIFRMPYIIHLHSGAFHTFYDNELGYIGRKFVVFVFRRASRVIALSSTWQAWLEQSMRLDNVSVVFNGVPSYTSNCVEQKKPTVLFLGRLGANKGTSELISAMREVARQIPDALLELGGDGDIEFYRKQAVDLPNVRFLGWLDDAGRRSALARATVYCLPSWNEGLPMSILEAMSAALPIVSTPVGGIPEAVIDGVTGFLVNPGDIHGLSSALSYLLIDRQTAKSMGHNGQARHRELFSIDVMGHSCLEVYASCVNH